MKVGLVLEGGGMRGLYTAGVLDAFLDADIKVDGIVAVSAGVLFGVNYPSKQKGRALRYNKKYAGHPNYMGFRSWLTTGNMVNKDFAYYELPQKLDVFDQKTFEESGVDFYATVTNLETGQAEYIKVDHVFDQMEVLRASSALPLASKIIYLDGSPYLDGGLSDSIPVDFAKSLGYDKLIVILTRPLDYRKKPSGGSLYKLFYPKYPNFIKTASMRWQHYNEAVEKVIAMEKAGELFAVRPSHNLDIGRLEKNLDKYDEVYELGLSDVQRILADLKGYLKK